MVPFVLGIVREVYSFKKTLDMILSDLASGQPKFLSKAIKAISSFSGSAKGVLGGFHYDITRSSYSRLESQIISAEALLIASVADDIIDEGGLEKNHIVEIVHNLLDTITKGVIVQNQCPEVQALSIVAKDLHTRVSKSPYPESFFSEYVSLAKVVILQINGVCSIELAEQTGGQTMAVSAIIPYCYNPTLPPRFLIAAKKFGGYLQVLDDVWDFEHDKKKGTNTMMTLAQSHNKMKVTAKEYASRLYGECLSQLNPSEQQMYKALNVLFHMKLVGERYFSR